MNQGKLALANPAFLPALLVFALLPMGVVRAQDRMPPIPHEKMTDAQKKAAAEFHQLRGADPDGPPWSVVLRVPDLLVPVLQFRLHYQSNPALGQKLTEFAILLAARHWTNNFEWNAHAPAALRAGLSPAIIAAVVDGRAPQQMADDEQILYDVCTELISNQSVSDPTYARALAKFGEAGIVEAASIEGYYSALAMIMNTARSPLPAAAKPALTPFPR